MFKHTGKDMVERYTAIRVYDLKYKDYKDTWLTRPVAQLNKIRFNLMHDKRVGDWYLELRQRGPNNFCSVINLERTPCHFGGSRNWFLCPACTERAGVLYLSNDDFRCRKCLNLCYESQKLNHRSIAKKFRKMMGYDATEWEPRWQSYKGKPTKRALRYEKKRQQFISSTKACERFLDMKNWGSKDAKL